MAKIMWFYQQAGEEQGPVSSAEIRRLAARGVLAPEDLIRRESMTDWVAAHRLRGVEFNPVASAVPEDRITPAGKATDKKKKTISKNENTTTGEIAGIGRRLVAFWFDSLIDTVLMVAGGVGGTILSLKLFGDALMRINWEEKNQEVLTNEIMANLNTLLVPMVIIVGAMFLLPGLYHLVFESTKAQGTLGKMVCKIRIVRTNGERVGLFRTLWRFLVKFLITFGILGGLGALTVFFTKQKQSTHDLLAGTIVVKK